MTALFEAAGLRYRYETVPALDGVDAVITRGRRVVLLGANGSGKSTFLRLLDGLDFAQEGSLRFDGAELTAARFDDDAFSLRFRQRVGLVFQNPEAQLFNPSVVDELAFGPLQLGWSAAEVRQRIAETMARMNLEALASRPPHRLSMGEKKRVAIASVLVTDPEVLLLDEPTAALDPKSQSEVIDLLAGWASGGRTAVTATHDLAIVEDIADECLVFERGRVVAAGTPREVLADEELLRRTGLVHAHRHSHGGLTHSHPHVHRHGDHEH